MLIALWQLRASCNEGQSRHRVIQRSPPTATARLWDRHSPRGAPRLKNQLFIGVPQSYRHRHEIAGDDSTVDARALLGAFVNLPSNLWNDRRPVKVCKSKSREAARRLVKAAIVSTYMTSAAFPGIRRLRDIALPPSAESRSCPIGLFRLSSFLLQSPRPF